MSSARKCDRCGKLFAIAEGYLSLGEVSVMTDDGETMNTWSDVDFCVECSAQILVLIGPALSDLAPGIIPQS